MNKESRYERLVRKYQGTGTKTRKSEMRITGGPDREKAMRVSGKPKNMKKTIARLAEYLTQDRKLLVIAVLCTILNAVTALAGSYLLRPIINAFIYYDPSETNLQARMNGLLGALLVLGTVYLVGVVTQWLQQRLMLKVSQNSLKYLRKDLYGKLQTLPMKYFDNTSTGDIMSRFTNDVDAVGEMLNTTLIQLISGIINIIGTVVLMLATNWLLGMITIIVTPLLTMISKTIIKKGQNAYADQ